MRSRCLLCLAKLSEKFLSQLDKPDRFRRKPEIQGLSVSSFGYFIFRDYYTIFYLGLIV